MMIKILIVFLLIVALIGGIYLWRYLTSIPNDYLIEQAYFVCEDKQLLKGGIVGKGPFVSFPEKNSWCWRWKWKKITRDEFKALVTQWYLVDWSNETQWWQN